MKKILSISFIGALILCSFGAVALNNDVEKPGSETIDYETSGNGRLDFTHTVLAEFGTTSSCPHCPPVSGYLYDIYNSGDYDFYFLTLNADKEPLANARYWEIPGASGSVPQVFFDGGYSTLIGNQGSKTPYISKIEQAGARSVPDIDLDLLVEWQGDAEMKVTVSVTNNEGSSYDGHLHAYITEISSRWYDNSGKKYHFSMIGYAFNNNIEVAAGGTWSEFVTWDGDSHGYGNIEEDNIMVIASVFDPSTKYVDETIAATPGTGSTPPDIPKKPEGPTFGIAGNEYEFSSSTIDPDGDGIFYMVDWGDGTYSTWLGPYLSGENVTASHCWDSAGYFNIRVKAKDDNGSGQTVWSTPLTIDIVGGPRLNIHSISGGLFKVSAVIENTGGLEANEVNWVIKLDGGAYIGKETSGKISVPAGEEVKINSGLVFGLGPTSITFRASIPDGPSDSYKRGGFVYLFFVKLNPGGGT